MNNASTKHEWENSEMMNDEATNNTDPLYGNSYYKQ